MGLVMWMVFIGVFSFLVSWFMRFPVPPGYANPFKLRCISVLSALMNLQVDTCVINGVRALHFIPEGLSAKANPGIVYIHGGGWCIGTAENFISLCQKIAIETMSVILSVDYCLAPEHPFPEGLDDCVKVATYMIQHAEEFNVDPNRVAIAGDSAGGNLAAATCLRLRDAELRPQPKLQVLIYPCLQAADFLSPSYQANQDGFPLTKEQMATFWIMYALGDCKYLEEVMQNTHLPHELKKRVSISQLQHEEIIQGYSGKDYIKPGLTSVGDGSIWKEFESTFMDPYFAPLMAEDVSNLPDAIVLTVEQDVLRDDGVWYARHLKKAGNNVTHMHYLAGFHGLLSIFEDSVNFDEFKALLVDGIKSQL